jgi:GT2 family glycosyltransferase
VSAPLVSIGLPVYNGERFLGHALDTLLGQTLEDFELITSQWDYVIDYIRVSRRLEP